MNETIYLKKLEQREIKPTAIRLLILKTMMQHKEAFSLLDLENELDTVDKSTIYRTITLFLGTFIKYYKISQLIHTQSIAN